MKKLKGKPIILDCTIRDGSYAVDFKFNRFDTDLLAKKIEDLGIEWIEIGHGLGLGAMQAGKGEMPDDEIDILKSVKNICKKSKIGMFFIPTLMEDKLAEDLLKRASDEGLDFVRIGANSSDINSELLKYVSMSKKLNIIPCLNLMKSYGISAEEFAKESKRIAEAGSDVIYCVDSSGGMFPEEVAEYISAARSEVDCELGFHGHNNLMMVISNCIEAFRNGANFLDATFCGLGRSAGNAPTEILIAAFERLGVSTGIDLFKCMDLIEAYIWPLVSKYRSHDMLGVTAGYSKFHSSFMPQLRDLSNKHKVDLKRLMAIAGLHDCVNFDKEFVDQKAEKIEKISLNDLDVGSLLDFCVPEATSNKIVYSMYDIERFIIGLQTTSAKSFGAKPTLILTQSANQRDGLLIPEYLMQDDKMILGRITYGTANDLKKLMEISHHRIAYHFLDKKYKYDQESLNVIKSYIKKEKVGLIRVIDFKKNYFNHILDYLVQANDKGSLFVYGYSEDIFQVLNQPLPFDTVYFYGIPENIKVGFNNNIYLKSIDDWADLSCSINVGICSNNVSLEDVAKLSKIMGTNGNILFPSVRYDNSFQKIIGDKAVVYDFNQSYSGLISQHLSVCSKNKAQFIPSIAEDPMQ